MLSIESKNKAIIGAKQLYSIIERFNLNYQYDKFKFRNTSFIDNRVGFFLLSYDKFLCDLRDGLLSLNSIPDGQINKKMCMIAINNDIKSVKMIPDRWIISVYMDVVFFFRLYHKNSFNFFKKMYCNIKYKGIKNIYDRSYIELLLNSLFEEMECRGIDAALSIEEVKSKKAERVKAMFYWDDPYEKYTQDKIKFENSASKGELLDNMSYDDFILELSKNHMLLRKISTDEISEKMCLIALYGNSGAIEHIPKDMEMLNNIQLYIIDNRMALINNVLPRAKTGLLSHNHDDISLLIDHISFIKMELLESV